MDEAYCEECGERDVTDALVSVDIATAEWHRTEVRLHRECRAQFVRANLEAVLASLRLVEQQRAREAELANELFAADMATQARIDRAVRGAA